MRTFSAIFTTRHGKEPCGHNHLTPTAAKECGHKHLNIPMKSSRVGVTVWMLGVRIKASDGKPISKADWKLSSADVRKANFDEWVGDIREYLATEADKK
jgi:hypothetical protein